MKLINYVKNKCQCFVEKIFGEHVTNYLIIFFVAVFVLFPLFSDKFPGGHDIGFHITNIRGLMQNVNTFFDFFSYDKILLNNSSGYGSLIFYPNLFYISTVFVSMIFSLGVINSMKIVVFCIFFFAGISMYTLVNKIFKDSNSALLSSVFYITGSYFISDFVVRSALAELSTFLFIPLVFLGLYQVIYEKKKFWLVLGSVGMINSHLVITMFLVIGVAIFSLFFLKDILKKDVLVNLFISVILILCLSSSFLVPMLEHKINGNYAVFVDGHMDYNSNISELGIDIYQYFYKVPYNNIMFAFPAIHFLLIFFIVSNLKKLKLDYREKKVFFAFILLLFIYLSGSLKIFPWRFLPDIFSLIQFPWRLAAFVLFFTAIITGFAIKFVKYELIPVTMFGLIALTLNFTLYLYDTPRFIVFDIERVNSYVSFGGQTEYLPISAHGDLDYFYSRENSIKVVSGDVVVENFSSDGLSFEATLVEVSDNIILELPRVFYFGYSITYLVEGELVDVDYYENENGYIEIELSDVDGELIVEYVGSSAQNVTNYVVFCTYVFIMMYLVFIRIKKKEVA